MNNRHLCILLSLLFALLLSGCVSSRVYYEPAVSPQALKHGNIYVEQLVGQNASWFRDVLIRELYKNPVFSPLETYPGLEEKAALLSGTVIVYSVRDEEQTNENKKVELIQKDIPPSKNNVASQMRQTLFEFVEVSFEERVIHRTIDLGIEFVLHDSISAQELYHQQENISFRQSYSGEEAIKDMRSSQDEIKRLGTLLIQRFLDKLSPVAKQTVLVLETGSAPIPWTFNLLDLGHPGILSGNRYAVQKEFSKAIKAWNYMIFEPYPFERSEQFTFSDRALASLKQAKIPRQILEPLLQLRNQSFSLVDIDKILLKLLGPVHFQTYGQIIKYHSRQSQTILGKNLASAHYNLGMLYQLLNQLKLAAYHFAQANAWNPQPHYAQAWSDVKYAMDDFNSLDTMVPQTIEAAGKNPPPANAIIHPQEMLMPEEEALPVENAGATRPNFEPEELPYLLEETQPAINPDAIQAQPDDQQNLLELN
ncbi:MAG: hypothetical protein HQM12_08355 [SAR324 cluster bacterium]|nr:hypothetical protein [SAR324 cluster bacterium]